jgi:hypothetical protein
VKRSEFFAEMGKGLVKTLKEVTTPFISEDLEKLDSFVDDVTGVKWYEVGNVESLVLDGFHDFFLAGNQVALIHEKEGFKAFEKVCPTCKMMPQWISYEKKFKCFNCEEELYVQNDTGKLLLKRYPVKIAEKKLFIGLK